jgi:hypothetical protein
MGEEAYGRRRIIFQGSLGFVGSKFEFCSRGRIIIGGHRFAGGFGHGGHDIHMVSWS